MINCFLIDIIENVASARYITCLDLQSGYYQIEMENNCAAFTALSGPHGHYEYTRSPMGIKTSPMVFVRLLDLVFQGLVGTEVFIYLNDIVFGAKTLSTHYTTFKKIAKRLQDANLTLNTQKCQFLQSKFSRTHYW